MVITVGHEKGGCGKTTTATNLAVWLARHGADVMLLDADRQRSATFWAAVRAASPSLPAVRCVQATGNISSTIRDLAQRYQHVVIDCGGLDSVELRSALLVSQHLIAPLRPSQFDLWSLAHLAEIVTSAQALNPSLRAGVALSLVPTNARIREGEEARAEVTKHGSLQLLAHQLCDRKAYRDAVRGGWGVIEMDDVKAADEIVALAEEIYGQVPTRSLAVA